MPTIGTRSDATKVLLGCARRGPEVVTNYPWDSEAVPAGVAGCLNSDGEFVAGAASPIKGISRGASLAHADKNCVTQAGFEVGLRLTDLSAAASGTIEIDDYAELLTDGFDAVTVGDVSFVAQSTAVTLGEATFRAATDDAATAASLAAQINAHEETMDLVTAVAEGAVVTVTAKEVGTDGNSIVFTYTDEGSDEAAIISGEGTLEGGYNAFDYVVPGATVFVDDTTGYATEDDEGTTETAWKYATEPLEGVSAAVGGSSVDCALVDM